MPVGSNGLAQGDNYTMLVRTIAGIFDGLQGQLESSSLKTLADARKNWPVCVINPPSSVTGPPTEDEAKGSAAAGPIQRSTRTQGRYSALNTTPRKGLLLKHLLLRRMTGSKIRRKTRLTMWEMR